jgi:MFS family permease
MAQMGLQPTMGKVYTYFNMKWTFIVGVLTFEVGSILCATARHSWVLVLGRSIAGAGTASIYTGGTTIISAVVPIQNRAFLFGIVSSMFGVSAVLGPILGGIFTDSSAGWRVAFWINPRTFSLPTNILCNPGI